MTASNKCVTSPISMSTDFIVETTKTKSVNSPMPMLKDSIVMPINTKSGNLKTRLPTYLIVDARQYKVCQLTNIDDNRLNSGWPLVISLLTHHCRC